MTLQTTPIINQIEQAVRDVPGWSPLDQLFALFTLACASADLPGDIVEIGSWCGRSAAALGLAARVSGRGRVHCVDLFPTRDDWQRNADGSYSFAVTLNGETIRSYDQQTVWAEPFERDIAPLYERCPELLTMFQTTIHERGLDDVVTPFRGDLPRFLAAMPSDFRCRLAFLDGHHSYQAVLTDIACIERCLLPGGWICFDDAFTGYEGVNRAIRERIIDSSAYCNAQQLTRKLFAAQKRQ